MLLIWCKEPKHKVMNAIAPVLNASPDLRVEVCNVFSHLPDRPELGAVLCMGSGPLEHLAALKAIPRNRTISSLRNRGHIVEGISAPAIFTYSSGIGEIDYGKFVDLQTDVALAVRLAKTGSLEPQMGTYRYVHYFTDLLAQVDAQYAATGKPVDLGFDLETIGFDPYRLPSEGHPGAYIVTMQASVKAGTGDVIYFNSREELQARVKEDKQFMAEIIQLMTSPKISIRGANLKFDLHWLHVWLAIDCTNFKFDTTMVGSILDENRSNALNVHAKVYTSMGGYDDRFNDSIDKSRMDLVPKDSLLPYAAGDADATLQVADAQKKLLLQDKSLARFYVNILHPAVRAMETVEQGGVCVDMKAYEELEQELNVEIDSLIIKAQTIMGGRIVAKHQDLSKRGGINLTKASLLNDFMFSPMGLNLRPRMMTPKGDKPATSMEHLLMFDDVPEAQDFVGILKDFSSATKTMGTYVTGFKSHIRSDGRFHPTYYLFAGNRDTGEGGTVTGRLSCKDPAFQTIPKHTKWAKKLRKCFVAPEGMLVMENDYSQGELRVIACVANEPTMIQAYRDGLDLHVITPSQFMGFTVEEILAMEETDPDQFGHIRQMGKAGNFGLIYGMSAGGFQAYAGANYGVKLSSQEADAFRNGFFNTYQALPEYHAEFKAHAKRFGHVRSPLGRVRNLPLINSPNREVRSSAERMAINSPIQSTLSDMMIWAVALAKERNWHKETPCFGLVHDAGYRYIPEDNFEYYARREVDLMENLPFERVGWNPQLTFTADCKVGKNMGEMSKVTF